MIILIWSTVGINIEWFGTAVGIFVGLLAVAICGALALFVIARDLLEESRQLEMTAIQGGKVLGTHEVGSERNSPDTTFTRVTGSREKLAEDNCGR